MTFLQPAPILLQRFHPSTGLSPSEHEFLVRHDSSQVREEFEVKQEDGVPRTSVKSRKEVEMTSA